MLPDVEVAVSAAGASAVASAPLLTRPARRAGALNILRKSITPYGVTCKRHQETPGIICVMRGSCPTPAAEALNTTENLTCCNNTLMHPSSKVFPSGITKSATKVLCQLARHATGHVSLLGSGSARDFPLSADRLRCAAVGFSSRFARESYLSSRVSNAQCDS